MLCWVGVIVRVGAVFSCLQPTRFAHSYDLDLEKKLAEETTVLMESYTVGYFFYIILSFEYRADWLFLLAPRRTRHQMRFGTL